MTNEAKQLKSFLDALAKDPRDVATRRVFADWLDEHDEPELAEEQRAFMTEETSFLTILRSDRYDRATRLVYADWLDEHDRPEEAEEQRRCATEEWCEASRFLHRFAEECRVLTYDEVVQIGCDYIDSGGWDWFTQHGSDEARDAFYRHGDKYWKAWEVVTGRKFNLEDEEMGSASPFSCSC